MKITVEYLKELEACEAQVKLFDETFPGGAELTLENLQRAASAELDIAWLARRVLSAPAREAYEQARDTARAAYDLAVALAFWNAYQAQEE